MHHIYISFHVSEDLDERRAFSLLQNRENSQISQQYELVVYAQGLVSLLCHVSNEGKK